MAASAAVHQMPVSGQTPSMPAPPIRTAVCIENSRAFQRLSPGVARAMVALELEPYRLISVHGP